MKAHFHIHGNGDVNLLAVGKIMGMSGHEGDGDTFSFVYVKF